MFTFAMAKARGILLEKESEGHNMDWFTTFITIVGVGTMASLLTRFLVWLDTPKKQRNVRKNQI